MSKMISLTLNRQIPCNYNNDSKNPSGHLAKTKKITNQPFLPPTIVQGYFELKMGIKFSQKPEIIKSNPEVCSVYYFLHFLVILK